MGQIINFLACFKNKKGDKNEQWWQAAITPKAWPILKFSSILIYIYIYVVIFFEKILIIMQVCSTI